MDTRKDKKYNLIKPFWVEVNNDNEEWTVVWPFGPVFSYQFKSISMVAMCWPKNKFIRGWSRCIVKVKYPNILEKLVVWFIDFISLLVREFSSIPIKTPVKVIISVDSFSIVGIVIVIDDVGGILIVKRKPAIMLPTPNRIIGLIKLGWFSFIGDKGRIRGLPNTT